LATPENGVQTLLGGPAPPLSRACARIVGLGQRERDSERERGHVEDRAECRRGVVAPVLAIEQTMLAEAFEERDRREVRVGVAARWRVTCSACLCELLRREPALLIWHH
jgi:hypothetical protein